MSQKEIGNCADARAALLGITLHLLPNVYVRHRVQQEPRAFESVCIGGCYTAVETGEGGVEIVLLQCSSFFHGPWGQLEEEEEK